MGALVGLSSIVGRQLGIRPKRFDDWTVVPNLWGAIVGRPGLLKSPAIREALRPLRNLSAAAQKQYESAPPGSSARVTVAKARRVDLERQLKEAIRKSNEAVESIESELAALVEPPPLSERRYETNDPTIEKLGEILAANPRGVLVSRDELVGFMRTLDKKGRENDRSFFLESWNGNTSYVYDRIGRGTIRIAAACVSILGGIQPGPLVGYLKDAAHGGLSDDGLMPRFQLLVYPDPPGEWRNVDRQPDFEARDRAYRIFTALDSIDLTRFVGHVCPCADDEIPTLHFAIDAQDLFDEWRTDLEAQARLGVRRPGHGITPGEIPQPHAEPGAALPPDRHRRWSRTRTRLLDRHHLGGGVVRPPRSACRAGSTRPPGKGTWRGPVPWPRRSDRGNSPTRSRRATSTSTTGHRWTTPRRRRGPWTYFRDTAS